MGLCTDPWFAVESASARIPTLRFVGLAAVDGVIVQPFDGDALELGMR